jgi:hypothetical protein
LRVWVPVGRGWAWRKGGWGWIWWIYFVLVYENRMKPVEVVLKRGKGKRENDGGGNSN